MRGDAPTTAASFRRTIAQSSPRRSIHLRLSCLCDGEIHSRRSEQRCQQMTTRTSETRTEILRWVYRSWEACKQIECDTMWRLFMRSAPFICIKTRDQHSRHAFHCRHLAVPRASSQDVRVSWRIERNVQLFRFFLYKHAQGRSLVSLHSFTHTKNSSSHERRTKRVNPRSKEKCSHWNIQTH